MDPASKEKTARSLTWTALTILLLGAVVGAPEAGVFAAIITMICLIFPLISGQKMVRRLALLLLCAAIALAFALYPAAKSRMDHFRSHAAKSATGTAAKPAPR